MTQTEWTDRSFNFDFPTGHWPIIISRLKGTFPVLQYIIQYCDPHILTLQNNNKWSIKQHIGHLTDLEELHITRISDFRKNTPVLSAWDGTNKKTEEQDHNNKNIDELLTAFKNIRDTFLGELLLFTDEELNKTALHPRLQKNMRIVDMAFFVAEHDDHHITKIREIVELYTGAY